MKKLLTLLFMLAVAFSLTMPAFAQETAGGTEAPKAEKKEKKAKKGMKKAKKEKKMEKKEETK